MIQQYTSAVATAMSIGSLIFFAGRESNRLDELFTKVHAAEVERKEIKGVIYDIHGRVCSIEKDIKYIKEN
jgi:hypothetical protein